MTEHDKDVLCAFALFWMNVLGVLGLIALIKYIIPV